MPTYVPCLEPPPLPAEDGSISPSSVLLDDQAYISADALTNATTAVGLMSNGRPINVSFCLARPPAISYLCVHFPGPAAGPFIGGTICRPEDGHGTPAGRCVRVAPRVISTHADHALLRVCIPGAYHLEEPSSYDYFVYRARPWPGASSLDLLPRLDEDLYAPFRDQDVTILRCSSSRYIVACLQVTIEGEFVFRFDRYDSDTRLWTSKLLLLDAPERDNVLPMPDPDDWFFHDTTKVITLGGPGGTVGWVDLWRGILVCDVLDETPELRDVPLPKPAKSNRRSFCKGCPHFLRDITVVSLPGRGLEVKYVETETRAGDVPRPPRYHSSSDSDSDEDDGAEDLVVADYWKANIWTMPVPLASWKDWRKDCTVDVTDIVVDNPRHAELLLALPRLSVDPEEAAMRLRRLFTGHPALGLGVDGGLVIYLLSKVDCRDLKGWMIAVGATDKKLLGIAQVDDTKNPYLEHFYCTTEISKYMVRATGEAGTLTRTFASRRKERRRVKQVARRQAPIEKSGTGCFTTNRYSVLWKEEEEEEDTSMVWS